MHIWGKGFVGWAAWACCASALEFALEGDRLTLTARREPLQAILERFAEEGVSVWCDPSIDVRVTGSCRSAPLEEALNALFEPFAYVAVWETDPGGQRTTPRLVELQVFRPGERERVRPLEQKHRLRVVEAKSPSGPVLYVADELLVRPKPGVPPAAFEGWLRSIGAEIVDLYRPLGVYRLRLPRGSNIPMLAEIFRTHAVVEAVEPHFAARLPSPSGGEPHLNQGETLRPPASVPSRTGAAPLAVLDSGIRSMADLEGFVAGRFDALFPDRAPDDPVGHGTQMALVAAGLVRPLGAAETTEAPAVLAIRAFDDAGVTSNFALFRAIDYALQGGARVLNVSWGTPAHSAFLAEAIRYAQTKGLLIVAAAGNEPTGTPMYPAAYPGVLAVSAMQADGRLWERSNRGDFVSIAAPGLASFPIGYQGPPGSYAGTSIASALVARELALYFARRPAATTDEALRALRAALTDAGAPGRDTEYGHGALDAAAQERFRRGTNAILPP